MTIELSSEESRLQNAYREARASVESIAAANHRTASAPAVLEAVRRSDGEELFVLCNLSALNLAKVALPDFVSTAPKRGFLGRKSYPRAYVAELSQRVSDVQVRIDQLLADGFVAGLAIASSRGEQLETNSSTPIYPTQAIQWYWEHASEYVWSDLDGDPVASDMLQTLSRGDVALLCPYADDVQRRVRSVPDPILSAAHGEYVARRGYALYWAHTKVIATRYAKEQMRSVAKAMSTMPPPSWSGT